MASRGWWMDHMGNHRVSLVLILLVVCQLVYFMVMLVGDRRERIHNAGTTAAKMARVAASGTEDFFQKYISMFNALKSVDGISAQETESTSRIFRRLLKKHPEVVNFAAVKGDGYFFASGKPMPPGKNPNIKDLDFFKRMAAGEPVVIMQPHMGPISQVFVTGIAVRLETPAGAFDGEMGVSILFGALERRWAALFQDSGMGLIVHDGKGEIYFTSLGEAVVDRAALAVGLGQGTGEMEIQGSTHALGGAESPLSKWRFSVLVPAHVGLFDVLFSRKELLILCMLVVLTLFGLVFWTSKERELMLQLKREQQNLKQSEERFRAIYEHAPVLIDAFDDQGKCILWNTECEKTFGWSMAEINAHGDALTLFYPDPAVHEEVVRTVTTDPEAHFREWHPMTKDGRILSTMWANFKLPDGLTFNLGYDITERRQAEADKQQLQEKLHQAQKMESIGQLAGGIAHDFNNILYPIMGNVELSQDELPGDHPVQEKLGAALDGAKRARDLIRRILIFARQKEQQLESTPLQPVIQESYTLLRSFIPANIDLSLELYDGEDHTLCDPSEIHEIILNLCTNAYHAIVADKGRILIGLDRRSPEAELLLPPGEYLCLRIRDNGVGIPEKIRDKVFDPYVTTKDLGKGSGLGLSVVYGIVQNYGGAIHIDSDPGWGTEFRIFLPVVPPRETVAQVPAEPVGQSVGREHILLVDDETAIVKLGMRILERQGYRVTGVNESTVAFECFEQYPEGFDLVVTDMSMPEMLGTELARRVKDIRPDIPVIICSGYSEKLDKMKAAQLNVSAFLDKPLLASDLIHTVRSVLDGQMSVN